MDNMRKIDPRSIAGNFIEMIGHEWMLVTAGGCDNFNTMTASWGAAGEIWGKPAAFVFVRPQRYTFGFMEENGLFTLSFFGKGYRKALSVCGSMSGREVDKVAEAGLTPVTVGDGCVAFAEASLVLVCRKMYAAYLDKGSFTDASIPDAIYPENDFHKMYVGDIVEAWVRDE